MYSFERFAPYYATYCQESLNKAQQIKFLNQQRGDWNAKRKDGRK